VEYVEEEMAEKQNLTVQLDRQTIRKAKVLAAQQGTSIGQLVAASIERMTAEEEAYEAAARRALAWLDRGLDLGGKRVKRESLHER
jgi:hypothetical protein